MWRRVWALIIKEFFTLWNDKRSRAVIIVPPIIQLVIFGYAATFDVSHVATAIYNEDGGAAATALVARFASSPPSTFVTTSMHNGRSRGKSTQKQ